MIQPWCTTSGWAQVASTARVMPATPAYTPRRAVAGVFIQCSAKTNRAVATMYGELDEAVAHGRPPSRGFVSVLNIFSMRSVMRKPLTMLVIEANRAIPPSSRITGG